MPIRHGIIGQPLDSVFRKKPDTQCDGLFYNLFPIFFLLVAHAEKLDVSPTISWRKAKTKRFVFFKSIEWPPWMMMVQHISFDENRTTLEFFTYIHCVGCNFLRGPPRVTMYTEQGNGTRSETGLQSHHQLTSGEKVTALPARDGWVWRRSLNLLDFYYLVFSIYIFYLE